MSDGFTLTPLRRIEARLVPCDWTWARDQAGAIAETWAARRAERPDLFDGPVLLARDCRIDGSTCAIDLFEVAYSQFLAFRLAGSPDPAVTNAFAAVVPWSADGAAVLGIMGGHTANAGQIYFACGTPDRADLRDGGRVDLAGSAGREFLEETGLTLPAGAPEEWVLVSGQSQRAFLRPVRFTETAGALQARMEAHRLSEAAPELAGFAVARGPDDLDAARTPGFVRAYLARAFAGAQR
ncbi:NUDIX hydrolase [Methylobacterium sp. M6A4_1b]